MARKSAIEVEPRAGRWARQKQGHGPAATFHLSEQEAILAGRQQAKRAGTDLVIRGVDGRIRQVDRLRARRVR